MMQKPIESIEQDMSGGDAVPIVPGTNSVGIAGMSVHAAFEAARLVADDFRGSSTAIIRGAKRFYDFIKQSDEETRKFFLENLVDRRVITPSEAKAPDSAKRSRLMKIGEHHDFLLRPELAEFLPTGIGPLYHFTLLYESATSKSDGRKPMDQFLAILRTAKGSLTRKTLIEMKQKRHARPPGGVTEKSKAAATAKVPKAVATEEVSQQNTDAMALTEPTPGADFRALRESAPARDEALRTKMAVDALPINPADILIRPGSPSAHQRPSDYVLIRIPASREDRDVLIAKTKELAREYNTEAFVARLPPD